MPHLDYGDVTFDKAYNNSFEQTGAIKVSSTEKLYQELGLETLQNRRWF